MFTRLALFLVLFLAFAAAEAGAQPWPFQDPDNELDLRVRDMISRMTLDEKVSQTLYDAPAIPRLGIPAYNWWNEALHGVARAGLATVFPQAIGLAATWDEDLLLRVATTISVEARAKYHHALRENRHGIYEGLTFWSPNINIFRDPRWGRGMETYGEDPFLTGRLAVQFVRGMQGDDPHYLRTVATPKHFAVHSGPEPDRHTFDAVVDERDLRETYLPAFRAAVLDGRAQSVMCAYNRFRGDPCCGSSELLTKILRGEWGFEGYVVSDCWALQDMYATHKIVPNAREAAAMALAAGTDLNCGVVFDSLGAAVRAGLVSEQALNLALERLFRARLRLGMFDPPGRDPYASVPYSVVDQQLHRDLAYEAAWKSIVLLKNDRNTLPLSPSVRSVAVIGPGADDAELLLGNYNGIPGRVVTPLDGIRQAVGATVPVVYARGCDLADHTPSWTPVPSTALQSGGNDPRGLVAEYFNNHGFRGSPVLKRVDSSVNFEWMEQAPAPGVRPDSFSVRWRGSLVPPVSGRYALGVRVFGSVRVMIDDTLAFEYSDRHVVHTPWAVIDCEAGILRRIQIEFRDRRADAICQLMWSVPEANLLEEALDVARASDVAILVLGLSPRLEGEEMPVEVPGFSGGDRTRIGLPDRQEELLQAVVETGTPVVLVLLGGSALAVPWAAEHVPAIAEAWYPGQAAGRAIADVLFGAVNPAGRLPVTFYRSIDDLPPFTDYSMRERTYRYFRGDPLFPFGHGLSYTQFEYRALELPSRVRAGDSVSVSVELTNVGERDGEEVVQLYLSSLRAPVPVPIRSLKGFLRIPLKAGERTTVAFSLQARDFSLIDSSGRRVVHPGSFEISVGGKQPGFEGTADSPTTGVLVGQCELIGETIVIDP